MNKNIFNEHKNDENIEKDVENENAKMMENDITNEGIDH